jgi:ABC-type antimicrobial peptide transport system permease subunit
MSLTNRILLFFVLPILGVFCYPPSTLFGGIIAVLVVVAMFIGLGFLMLQGRSLALTFSIFLQGMNVIIRIMMFVTNGFPAAGSANIPFLVTSVIGMIVSFWLITRLDIQDVRLIMIR